MKTEKQIMEAFAHAISAAHAASPVNGDMLNTDVFSASFVADLGGEEEMVESMDAAGMAVTGGGPLGFTLCQRGKAI